MKGLYLTKDFGANWTKVRMAGVPPTFNPPGLPRYIQTNDDTQQDYDVLGPPTGNAQGNYDATVTVDPNNPAIVYVGGTRDGQPYTLIRVDTTGIDDPWKMAAY